ncbi:EAL domain-containing protein [Aeromicrobium fastidiosum]|uniref:EAL domain-containing protein n=1 Tax=Aeromicrobium fastidiosum TaxID=52699 RepID=A0A641AM43_9ACTN|nr:EAL domain-containing protein [Aeromicrobium fastidiosum]KAA1374791.1 EAL domain-containing protein [Aeromicrobium fastidiosum]MBP2390658.1 PAS domain S-box-containing protein [Aeromicrobium fastidiosum]
MTRGAGHALGESLPDGYGAWPATGYPARMVWESSADLLIVTDRDGVLRAANPAWRRVMGWTDVPSPPVRLADLVHDDDRSAVQALFGRDGDRFEDHGTRLRTVAGDYREIDWSGSGDEQLWYASGRDVTDLRRSEQNVREASAFWQATIDSMPGTVTVLDEQGVVLAVNAAWRDLADHHGRARVSDIGRSYIDACDSAGDEPGARRAVEAIRDLLAGRSDPVTFDYALDDRWFTFTASAFAGDGPARVVVSHADITARRRREDEDRAQSAALADLGIAVVTADRDHHVTHWSAGAVELLGWSRAEALDRPVADLIHPQHLALALGGDPAIVEGRYELARKDGSTFAGHLRWTEVLDGHGVPAGSVGVAMDVSAQDRAESEAVTARNHLQAVTDSMTEGLFALDGDGRVTLMNQAAEDMLGWSLDEVRGQRLHDITRHHRSDGRFDGVDDCTIGGAGTGVIRIADDVFRRRDGMGLPVSYTTTPLETSGATHGSVVVFMDASHVLLEQERLQKERASAAWIDRVQETLDESRLLLYAQPIVELSTMDVVQQELLLRIAEKDGTISAPARYLETAEKHGLIGDIDRWVVRQAIDLAAQGQAVEVNVSAASIGDEALLRDIERWLAGSGADPSLVVFEITETTVIADQQAGRYFVDLVHRLGCKVALDDFGTGYSGFAYLKQLPVDYLKIDMEFVRDMSTSQASWHVVEAVVNLARGFGLATIAEGVEDTETLELLAGLGVDHAQGFHLGRPSPLPSLSDPTDAKARP